MTDRNGPVVNESEGFKLDQSRVDDLLDEYGAFFGNLIDARLPTIIDNGEYAARTAALMITLNRQLARVAAACGEAQQVDDQVIGTLVVGQFAKNHASCVEALRMRDKVLN
jgi:hypothetical protein